MGGNFTINDSELKFVEKVGNKDFIEIGEDAVDSLRVSLNGAFGDNINDFANEAANKAGVNSRIGELRQVINDKIIYEEGRVLISKDNFDTLEAGVEALEKTRSALDQTFTPENIKTGETLRWQVRAELDVGKALCVLRGLVYFSEAPKLPLSM